MAPRVETRGGEEGVGRAAREAVMMMVVVREAGSKMMMIGAGEDGNGGRASRWTMAHLMPVM